MEKKQTCEQMKKGFQRQESHFHPLLQSSFSISPQTTKGGEDLRNIEAADVETSNWVRFVNAPRNVFEENVVTRQCRDK